MPLDKEQTLRADKLKTDRQVADLQGSLDTAAGGPPAAIAQNVFRLSDRTGLPADTVSRNLAEVTARVDAKRADARQIITDSPRTAEYLQTPRNAAVSKDNYEFMQALEKHRSGPVSYLGNAAKMSGEALNTLTGDLAQWVGTMLSGATDTLWQEFKSSYEKDGKQLPAFDTEGMNPETQKLMSFVSTLMDPGGALQDVGRAVSEGGLGSVPNYTWENFEGDMTPKNLAGFLGEQLAVSVPHMAAMLISMPAYVAATDQRLAESRSEASGEVGDPSIGQLMDTLPSAILVSLIEQYSTKGMLGRLEEQAFKTGGRFAAKELGKSAVREGGTEAVQEAIEYVTERFGIEGADMSGADLWDRVLPAIVGGAGVGVGFRSVSLGYQTIANKVQGDANLEVNSHIGQINIDGAIESIQSNTLMQSDPDEMRKFLQQVGPNDKVFFSPDGVQAAIDAGLTVPQHMTDQLGTEQDVAVSLESFGMDVVANEELLASLRPHMKNAPELLTQSEIQSRDGSAIKDMIKRAQESKEDFDEAKAIHAEVADALVATGRLSAHSAKYSAQLIPAYVTTKVAELRGRGIETTVSEVYEALGLRIGRKRGTSGTGVTLQQAAEQGYDGKDIGEAAEWVAGVAKFGAEGMTTEARMARAKEMGFDTGTVWYHGTNADIPEFKLDVLKRRRPFVFVTKSPEEASAFAEGTKQDFDMGDEVVYPVHIRAENTFDYENDEHIASVLDAIGKNRLDASSIDLLQNGDWPTIEGRKVQKVLRELGFDSFYAFELGHKNLAVYDPNQIRSVNATFDPDAATSPKLLSQSPVEQRSPEFKRWFGDSKVVDENGEPLVVYHGTDQEFDTFDAEQVSGGALGDGFYFAEDLGEAESNGENIMPVYLSIQNPLVLSKLSEVERQTWNKLFEEEPAIAQEKAIEGGYDGVLDDVYTDRNWVAFEPTQVKSAVGNRGTFDPNDPNILSQQGARGPRGEIQLLDDARIIRLSNTSDLSTFLHETGHLFLEAEKHFAAKYGLSDNQQTILDLLGVATFDDIGVAEHELFARSFEDYLRTGNAPSVRLRDAFAAFARWLAHIYADLRQLGMKLDPEVTKMFDRLLASDIEAEEVLAGAPYKPLFRSKEQAGVTDAEWKKYLDRVEKRNTRTKMTLSEKVLKEYRNRRSKEWNEEKQPIVDREMVRLKGEPVYQMLASLKEVKLDSDMVKAIMGGVIPKGRVLGNVVKTGGQDPDVVAEQYGYATTKQMLDDIHRTPTLIAKAESNAEAKMVNKYGDIFNDGSLEMIVKEATHNDAEEQLLLSELRMLTKKQRKPGINRAEVEYEAKLLISKLTFSEIDPHRYYRAEVRAAEKAGKATKPAELLELKKTQLANQYLFREATRARADTTKRIAYVKKAWARRYSTRDVDGRYIEMMKEYAGMYNDKRKPEQRRAAAEKFYNWLKGQQKGGVMITLKDQNILAALDQNGELSPDFVLKKFSELNTEEVYSVYEMVKHMRYVGGGIAAGKTAQMEALREEGAAAARATGTERARKDELTRMDTLKNSISHILNTIPSMRNLIRNLDGWDENGFFYRHVWAPLAAAENVKLRATMEFYNNFESIVGPIAHLGLSESKGSRESVPRAATPDQPFTLSSTGRFMLAVYWGTESSREAIRQGHKVTDAEVHAMMAFLTPAQLETVNKLWKFNETMAAPLFAAGVRRDGVAPEKIPHAPFTVNGVEMTGGHMTLHYTLTQPEIRLDETSLAVGVGTSLAPSKATALHARRTSGGRTVDLTTANINKSIDENAHYIAYAEAGLELQRLLGNKDVKQAIIDTRGEGFHRAMMQSMAGITTNRVEAEMYPTLAHAITVLKTSKSAMYLMYNLKNILQQIPSVFPAMVVARPDRYVKAALEFYGTGLQQNIAFVHGKSPQMANRKATMTRESSEVMRRTVSGTPHELMFNKLMQHGFTPHVVLDLGISYPLWMSVYNEGLTAHGDDARAARDADVAVNQAVGTGLDIGMGKALHSNQSAHIKLLTLFGSWFNSTIFQRAYEATKGGTSFANARAVEALFITPAIVMMASEALAMNIPNLWRDEEDREIEGAGWWFIKNFARFASGTIPLLGGMMAEINGFTQKTLLQDLLALPADTIDAISKTAKGDMGGAEGLEALIKTLGTFTLLPGSGNVIRALDYSQSVEEGDTINPFQAVVEGRDRNQ